jgi:hypothetical protein
LALANNDLGRNSSKKRRTDSSQYLENEYKKYKNSLPYGCYVVIKNAICAFQKNLTYPVDKKNTKFSTILKFLIFDI